MHMRRFDQLVPYLREMRVISTTKTCLERIHRLAVLACRAQKDPAAPETVSVRVFLAGYMIAYRPTHVFESMGELEQKLFDASKPVLEHFRQLCYVVQRNPTKPFGTYCMVHSKEFPDKLFTYLGRFREWKVPDEMKLRSRIKHALVAMYQGMSHLPADEAPDSKLNTEFKTQIRRLRTKLVQIAGEEALAEFERENPNCKAVDGEIVVSAKTSTLPSKMTNEQLAHELLLDPMFQLREDGTATENPIFQQIRQSFHKAFWDSLVDDLKLTPPCYVRIMRVLTEIRDGLCGLAYRPEQEQLVKDVIDLELIKGQISADVLPWASCMRMFESIVEVVMRIQKPSRDAETKSKWEGLRAVFENSPGTDQPLMVCKGLEFLLDRVNAMRIDAANGRLKLITGVISTHGVEYERGKLQERLNDGTVTLDRTKAWIEKHVAEAVAGTPGMLKTLAEGSEGSFVAVHGRAMLGLVFGEEEVTANMVPETLRFDDQRLWLMQAEARYQVLASALIVKTMYALTVAGVPKSEELAKEISDIFVEQSACNADWTEMARKVTEAVSRHRESAGPTVETALAQVKDKTDAVHQLMRTRVRGMWEAFVLNGAAEFKPLGSAVALFPRVRKWGMQLRRLTDVNKQVHVAHYNSMISTKVKEIIASTAAVK